MKTLNALRLFLGQLSPDLAGELNLLLSVYATLVDAQMGPLGSSRMSVEFQYDEGHKHAFCLRLKVVGRDDLFVVFCGNTVEELMKNGREAVHARAAKTQEWLSKKLQEMQVEQDQMRNYQRALHNFLEEDPVAQNHVAPAKP